MERGRRKRREVSHQIARIVKTGSWHLDIVTPSKRFGANPKEGSGKRRPEPCKPRSKLTWENPLGRKGQT
ncbi:hypothetical protein [Escherichia phage vB_EcoS_ULIM2]|nr:hypothetical protein [Escherichia phage vB_EcoS_ULIM2]